MIYFLPFSLVFCYPFNDVFLLDWFRFSSCALWLVHYVLDPFTSVITMDCYFIAKLSWLLITQILWWPSVCCSTRLKMGISVNDITCGFSELETDVGTHRHLLIISMLLLLPSGGIDMAELVSRTPWVSSFLVYVKNRWHPILYDKHLSSSKYCLVQTIYLKLKIRFVT